MTALPADWKAHMPLLPKTVSALEPLMREGVTHTPQQAALAGAVVATALQHEMNAALTAFAQGQAASHKPGEMYEKVPEALRRIGINDSIIAEIVTGLEKDSKWRHRTSPSSGVSTGGRQPG